ncbi:MAG: DUF983 domain-containing protein [Chitinophagales bacterium]|nr:DUF983 domain-containing protein [Chitinophagales bacterium]
MFGKGSKLYSIVGMKCPRCHEGPLWRSPFYKLKLYDMHESCPVCGLKYEREVGFWWGAMYVAYTFSSGALLIVMLVTLLVLKWELPAVFTAVGITALIGFTYNARLARSAWINMVVHYNPNWRKENEENEKKLSEAKPEAAPIGTPQ